MDKSIVPANQIAARSSTCYEFSHPNGAEVVEIADDDTTVRIVEKQIEDLKLNHQFNEKETVARQIENLKLHGEEFTLTCDSVAPEEVLRVIEHFFNSDGSKECILSSRNNKVNIDEIINVLQSQSDGSKIIEGPISFENNFTYYYVKSGKRVGLFGNENCIGILNITD